MEEEIAVVVDIIVSVSAVVLGFFSITFPPSVKRITRFIAIPVLILFAVMDFQVWRTTSHGLSDHIRCWIVPDAQACTWIHKPAPLPAPTSPPVSSSTPLELRAPPPEQPRASPVPLTPAPSSSPAESAGESGGATATAPLKESTVAGSDLMKEAEKDAASREERGAAFDKLFVDLPTRGFQAAVTSVSGNLPAGPSLLELHYQLRFDPSWISALETGLSKIAFQDNILIVTVDDAEHADLNRYGPFRPSLERYANAKLVDMMIADKHGRTWGAQVCVHAPTIVRCYLLPLGAYGANTLLNVRHYANWALPLPVLRLQALDKSGAGVGKCVLKAPQRSPNAVANSSNRMGLSSSQQGKSTITDGPQVLDRFIGQKIDIDDYPLTGVLVIDRNSVDLTGVDHFSLATSFVVDPTDDHYELRDATYNRSAVLVSTFEKPPAIAAGC